MTDLQTYIVFFQTRDQRLKQKEEEEEEEEEEQEETLGARLGEAL